MNIKYVVVTVGVSILSSGACASEASAGASLTAAQLRSIDAKKSLLARVPKRVLRGISVDVSSVPHVLLLTPSRDSIKELVRWVMSLECVYRDGYSPAEALAHIMSLVSILCYSAKHPSFDSELKEYVIKVLFYVARNSPMGIVDSIVTTIDVLFFAGADDARTDYFLQSLNTLCVDRPELYFYCSDLFMKHHSAIVARYSDTLLVGWLSSVKREILFYHVSMSAPAGAAKEIFENNQKFAQGVLVKLIPLHDALVESKASVRAIGLTEFLIKFIQKKYEVPAFRTRFEVGIGVGSEMLEKAAAIVKSAMSLDLPSDLLDDLADTVDLSGLSPLL